MGKELWVLPVKVDSLSFARVGCSFQFSRTVCAIEVDENIYGHGMATEAVTDKVTLNVRANQLELIIFGSTRSSTSPWSELATSKLSAQPRHLSLSLPCGLGETNLSHDARRHSDVRFLLLQLLLVYRFWSVHYLLLRMDLRHYTF